jgi:hypothetical protein
MNIKRTSVIASIVIAIALSASVCGGKAAIGEKIELTKMNILDGKVEILIPSSFKIMSEEWLKLKYPNENRPSLVYTNDDGSVDVGFRYTELVGNLPELRDNLKSAFTNLYPSAKWYRCGIEGINGKEAVVLEFISPAIDTEIYNLLWITILDGKLMFSTFNCTKKQLGDWKEAAGRIMGSFREL